MKKNPFLRELPTFGNNCKNLFRIFEQHARDYAEKPAIIRTNQIISYHALLVEVKKMINVLRASGIKSGDHIIVALHSSTEIIKIFLSTAGLGAIYVPIDPCFPKGRLEFIINEIKPALIITEKRYGSKFSIDAQNIWLIDEPKVDNIAYQESENIENLISIDNIAYIIYTSGSTGTPKGVPITYGSLINVLKAVKSTIKFSTNDTMLFFSKPWFDIANIEFLLPILNGATLAIPPQEFFMNGEKLSAFLKETGISVIQTTPSVWNILLESRFTASKGLKVITTGEELTQDLSKKLLDRFENVWNFYGPTECTIYATASKILSPENVTIGYPLGNTIIKIFDSQNNEVAEGIEGEIYIGGVGVSPGYYQRPELNNSKFINITDKNGVQTRYYVSGDLGKYLPDGSLKYLGRKDSQIKFRGLRIDLQEIAHVIKRASFVKDVVVCPQYLESSKTKLIAYISLKDKGNTDLKKMYRNIEVSRWKQIYDGVYDQEKIDKNGMFNTAGWRDSYRGEFIDSSEIEEIVDTTVSRIRTYSPKRILEIGCGTGLLLFKLVRHCEEYIGTDISKKGLDFVKRKLEQEEIKNVSLFNQEATNMEGIMGLFDFIIINSVVHHFPDTDYLKEVIKKLETFLANNGTLLIGDIRNKELLRHYHLSVVSQKAREDIALEELLNHMNTSVAREKQLLLPTSFFRDYFLTSDTFCHIDIWPKTAKLTNEITKFRYDVVLSKKPAHQKEVYWNEWSAENWSYPQLKIYLKKGAESNLALRRVPNPKIFFENQLLQKADNPSNLKKQLCDLHTEPTHDMQRLSIDHLQKMAQKYGYKFEASYINPSLDGSYDIVFSKGDESQSYTKFLNTSPSILADKKGPLYPQKEKDNIILELYELCADALPEYMVPSDFMIMDALPITSSGKIDLQKLPKPHQYTRSIKDKYVKPNTKTEKALAAIWKQVLGIHYIGIEDNFFRLGGDSILCMLMIRRAKEKNIYLNIQMVFSHPTIKKLGEFIDYEQNKVYSEKFLEIKASKSFPLTPAQILVLNFMQNNKNVYCQHVMLKCDQKNITESSAKKAIEALIREHDALRNVFSPISGANNGVYLEQICQEEISYVYRKKDLSKLPLSEVPNALQKYASDIFQSIDIEKGLLVGLGYFDCGQEGLRILIAIHSLVVDNISLKILCEKFEEYCHKLPANMGSSIKSDDFSFSEWCSYLDQYKDELISKEEIQYWKNIERKIEKERPTSKIIANICGFKESLTKEETAAILENTLLHDLDPRSILLTILAYALLKSESFGDQSIEIESHGRYNSNFKNDLSKAVGHFSTFFPFYFELDPYCSFWQNAYDLKKELDNISFGGSHYQLIKTLHPNLLPNKRRPRISFNYLGVWQDNPFFLTENRSEVLFSYAPERIKNLLYEQHENIVGLAINILNIQGRFSLAFKYNQNIFSKGEVRDFANKLLKILIITANSDE